MTPFYVKERGACSSKFVGEGGRVGDNVIFAGSELVIGLETRNSFVVTSLMFSSSAKLG